MASPELVAACVLVNPRGEVLMGLRADRREWEVPGGKVQDESVLDAWHRELKEEAGLTTDVYPDFLGVSEPDPAEFGGRRYFIVFLAVRHWEGTPAVREPDKCLEWRWWPLSALPPAEKMTPGTRDFAREMVPSLLQEE